MSMSRRQAVRLLAATPLMGVIEWTPEEVDRATMQIGALRSQYQPQFFNEHEWRTVHVLVDLIIPRDERSGSATDANVPEFIDFMVNEGSEGRKRTIRQGLQWLDADIRTRTGKTFLESTDAQRRWQSRRASISSTASAISLPRGSSRAKWDTTICNTNRRRTLRNGRAVPTRPAANSGSAMT
jgi:hypothetical protein